MRVLGKVGKPGSGELHSFLIAFLPLGLIGHFGGAVLDFGLADKLCLERERFDLVLSLIPEKGRSFWFYLTCLPIPFPYPKFAGTGIQEG